MDKTYLYVPFEEKDQVKSLGGRWDARLKCWYVEMGQDVRPFRRWLGGEVPEGGEYSIASEQAYVVSGAADCWKCRALIEVVCVYCESGEIRGERYEQFTVSNITAVDEPLRERLARWPFFRLAYSKTAAERCLANHCPHCRLPQDDYFLHCEPRGAFFALREAPRGLIELTPLHGRVCMSGDEGFEP